MLVVGSLIGQAQSRTILNRSIHDNLHLMRYIIQRIRTKAGFGGALVNLYQSKAFNKVNQRYLEAVLKAAGFGSVFSGWVTAMHSDTCSVAKVKGHLS